MSKLRVRVYNVFQGDAILVTVPDRKPGGGEVRRHILIDVGNRRGQAGSSNKAYKDVFKDVQQQLKSKRVDLYVMTHEHMDHVEGLPYASEKLKIDLKARYAWLTASADPNYYQTHPKARKAMELATRAYDELAAYLAAAGDDLPQARALLELNNYKKTADCVAHLRTIAPKSKTHYVYRGYPLAGAHPFTEAKLEILAPEEDTSDYYLGIRAVALGLARGRRGAKPELRPPLPLPGVEAGSFYQLVRSRRNGYLDDLLAIDQAKNNTSVVFRLTWRRWVLLFTGDAEQKSWWKMYRKGVLGPIHFLKVGHHGSHNATPGGKRLDTILPKTPPDQRRRSAAISAYRKAYGHPHAKAIQKLKPRVDDLRRTEQSPSVPYVDFELS